MKKYHFIGFIVTAIFGTLLHFVYKWSGEMPFFGIIGAANESVWEHTKLLAIPMLIYGAAEYFLYGRELKGFLPARLLSILLGMAIIIAGYYTYTGAFGTESMAADIALFYVAVAAAYGFGWWLMKERRFPSPAAEYAALAGVLILLTLIIWFSLDPPKLPLFMDSITGGYGIKD